MFSRVNSAAIVGVTSRHVTVEADISDGLPMFHMVGYLASEVREASERVRSALRNSNVRLPVRHITVNLAPADLRKEGCSFDLPIAIAVLDGFGFFPAGTLDGILFLGELSLGGQVCPIRGALEIVSHAQDYGCHTVILPHRNLTEGSVIRGVRVLGADCLMDVIDWLRETGACPPLPPDVTYQPVREGTLSPSADGPVILPSPNTARIDTSDRHAKRTSPGTVSRNASSDTNAAAAGARPLLYRETVDIDAIRRRQALQCREDFSELRGQPHLRRASEIAVAGFHNLLMVGPPGAGKTMAAQRIPTILPETTLEEALEITKIHSIAGTLPDGCGLMTRRPFRSPHHTISGPALAGGGSPPRPGEVSLAHRGILYLDEIAEFKTDTLEILRQPLEDGRINISRVTGNFPFPARFMLVASMNPCKCGYFPDMRRCTCTRRSIRLYQSHISMPLLDRIDLCADARPVEYEDLTGESAEECSASIRARVLRARERQEARYAGTPYCFNAELDTDGIERYCVLTPPARRAMEAAYRRMGLTVRSYCRILKVARTIADLDGSDLVAEHHLAEALRFKPVDRRYWDRGAAA